MAWTTPRTWASGYVVLASDLNTHLRDNLNVTAPAVMSSQGDVIYASGANAPARLAKDANATRSLTNTGSSNNPAWAQVALATGVSGTLPVGSGGTGATSFTANGILVGNSTSAVAVTATMATKGHLMVGDGSGVPSMLAVGGTNDHVLTVDSGEPTGLKWASATAGAAKIATGTYTGDGTTSQAITGVGFTVKWVWITARKTADGDLFAIKQLIFTSDQIIDDTSGAMVGSAITIITGSGDVRIADRAIIALGSDGFTVDDAAGDSDPNKESQVYNYMALG
jgi:hypothetical protein